MTGRYIVLLDAGTDTSATVERMGRQKGIKADRTFGKTIRGFSARLDAKQRKALEADPNVVAVVPDEVIQVDGQTTPTGVSRIVHQEQHHREDQRRRRAGRRRRGDRRHRHPAEPPGPQRRRRLQLLDLEPRGMARRPEPRHARRRHGRRQGQHASASSASRPGARLWAVKILNDDGYGLLSWYVCGLDWILAQRDPADPTRPLIEAANMSVAKSGDDDPDCGASEQDVLHLAICRVVKGGITVVAAAGNDQMSAAQLGAGRVQRGHHRLGPGRHRRQARRARRQSLLLVGLVRHGRHVRRTSATTARDVDIIAPGKCIWSTKPGSTYGYMSGTSMATPAVTGAAALYKASRPKATPAEVREALQYLGNLNWKTSTDPDSYHERLLDVSKLGPLGTFSLERPDRRRRSRDRRSRVRARSRSTAARRSSSGSSCTCPGSPTGWTAHLDRTSVFGWTAKSARLNVTAPPSVAAGTYEFTITGTNQGRSAVDRGGRSPSGATCRPPWRRPRPW